METRNTDLFGIVQVTIINDIRVGVKRRTSLVTGWLKENRDFLNLIVHDLINDSRIRLIILISFTTGYATHFLSTSSIANVEELKVLLIQELLTGRSTHLSCWGVENEIISTNRKAWIIWSLWLTNLFTTSLTRTILIQSLSLNVTILDNKIGLTNW